MKAWQCIGCGRIESNATCLGMRAYRAAQERARRLLGAEKPATLAA